MVNKSDFWFEMGKSVFHVMEGTGDNLSEEDEKEGFVDYIYYEEYDKDSLQNVDGGECLLEHLYSSYSVEEIIDKVLGMSSIGITYKDVKILSESEGRELEEKVEY